MIVSSDNTDKRAYPTQVFDTTDVNLLDALVGEVVWTGRYLGSGKKADVRNRAYKPIPWPPEAVVLGQVMWTGRTL